MIRRVVLFIVLLAIWLGVLGWAAGVPWNAPIWAREHVQLDSANFHLQGGSGSNEANGLVVTALAVDGTSLQTAPLDRLRAQDFPVLRYRIADFPEKLELSLVFRRADAPTDVQTISIPAPGIGTTSVDLAALADWRGEITELGFAEYPVAQLVPASVATFRPFRIEDVQLQSPSWSQVLSRLISDWFGYRPWALRSINTFGPQVETVQPSWMQPIIVLGALLSLLATWIILRWPRWHIARAAVFATLAVWVLLDLRWLDDFIAKHRVIEQIFADKSWDERAHLQPDLDTLAAARNVARYAVAHDVKRVLVVSDSSYTLLRFIYFLLPLNAAPMQQVLDAAPGTPPPRDALIVAFNSAWSFDAASGNLSNGAAAIAVTPVYVTGGLRVYRAHAVAP
jgi:hypothetical protein